MNRTTTTLRLTDDDVFLLKECVRYMCWDVIAADFVADGEDLDDLKESDPDLYTQYVAAIADHERLLRRLDRAARRLGCTP